ncbi:hypothetical protein MAUB1S_01461 [Mycolicibacterium aubagnense]
MWDRGPKTFACRNFPLVLGYWGQVVFPALVLPIIQERADLGLYAGESADRLHKSITSTVRRQWEEGYPDEHHSDLGIIIASRRGEGMASTFSVSVLTYSSRLGNWQLKRETMPTNSSVLRVAGSGAEEVRRAVALWNQSSAADTSRGAFSAFCEAVAGGGDPNSGGPPQLVGLHRVGAGKRFGVVVDGQRYLAGADVTTDEQDRLPTVGWFNELFERVDPARKKRRFDAQVHLPR